MHLLAELGEVGGQNRRGDDERTPHLPMVLDFACIFGSFYSLTIFGPIYRMG
jgi:hypothetical protein